MVVDGWWFSSSHVWLSTTPWTVAHQAPLSMGFSRKRILDCIVILFCRGSAQPRDWTEVSGIVGNLLRCRRILYQLTHQGSPWLHSGWKFCSDPGGLQSMGSLRVRHDWATSLSLFTFMHWRRKWQPTPVFLPGESQGQGSLVGCHLWGRTELDTTEAT